jgi:4-amino-4-deoxy-L-arabinose transferase-like glycosyltransferase
MSDPTGSEPRWRPIFLVFAVALAVRLAANAPCFADPEKALSPDSPTYLKIARNIREHGHHLLTLHRPPGYPYVLAVVQGTTGSEIRLPLLLNLAADAVTAALIFMIAAWLRRPRREGWIAAGLYSIQPLAIFGSGQIMTESLFTLLLLIALWSWFRLSDDERRMPAFACGLAFGGGILFRVLLSYLIPILLILKVARDRSRWRQACSCLAGVAVLTLPFVLLHGLKLGEWTFANTSRGSVIGYEAPAVLSLQAGRSLGDFMTEESFLVEGKKVLRRRGGWDPRSRARTLLPGGRSRTILPPTVKPEPRSSRHRTGSRQSTRRAP